MYSRYIPNETGGYERRRVPDAWEQEAGSREAGSGRPGAEAVGSGIHPVPPHPGGHDPPQRSPGPQYRQAGPPRHPPVQQAWPSKPPSIPGAAPRPGPPPRPGAPGPPPFFPGSVFGGLDGLLGRLLPRGLDPEELLILAILLLAMKQDGAGSTELLIAAALYLLL